MPKWLFIRVSWEDTGEDKMFQMVTVRSSKDVIKSKVGNLKGLPELLKNTPVWVTL